MDMWHYLSEDLPSPQRQILHNIDDIANVSAIRVGDYKLVQGTKYGQQWNGWYGPSGREPNDAVDIRDSRSYQTISKLKGPKWTTNVTPAEVKCGAKPLKTGCEAWRNPCLFNIAKDPCEYHNLADVYPNVVQELLKKIDEYRRIAVKPGNKPSDPRANPILNGGVWTNWYDQPL